MCNAAIVHLSKAIMYISIIFVIKKFFGCLLKIITMKQEFTIMLTLFFPHLFGNLPHLHES